MEAIGIYSRGTTALHEAAVHGEIWLVEHLLEQGVSVHTTVVNNACMFNGQTAIDIAAFYGYAEMVRKLHESGGCLRRKRGGKSTLHHAAEGGRYDVVQLLLELGACVDEGSEVQGLKGVTALHVAAEKGHDKIVTLLLEHMADVHKKIIDGRCALHCAARENRLLVAELLLEAGSFVNRQSNTGQSVLFEAASRGYSNMVALLLRYGANTKSSIYTCFNGRQLQWTPYTIAESRGYADVLRVFDVAFKAREWARQLEFGIRTRTDCFMKHVEKGTVPELIGQWAPELSSEIKEEVFLMAARAVNDSRNAYLLFYESKIRHVTPSATPAEGTQTKFAMKLCNSGPEQENRDARARIFLRNTPRFREPLSKEFNSTRALETASEQKIEGVKAKRRKSFVVNPTGSIRVKWELGTTIPLALWRRVINNGVPGIRRLIISFLLHKNSSVRFMLREMATYASNENGVFKVMDRSQKEEASAVARTLKVRRINEVLAGHC